MTKATVTVKNSKGLHERPATYFIMVANCFKSYIWLNRERDVSEFSKNDVRSRGVNAKVLAGILSLGIVGETTIQISADGQDEDKAIETLVALIKCGFEEKTVEKILKSASEHRTSNC